MPVRIIHNWWYVDIRHMGTRYRKRCPSNNQFDATRYEQLLRRELARHGSLDHMQFPRATRVVLLEDLFKRWLCEYVRVNSRPCVLAGSKIALLNRVLPVIGNRPVTEVGVQEIDRLKAHFIEKGNSAKTTNNYLGILRRCLRSAVEWELLDRVPRIQMLKVVPPTFRYLEPDEARRLVATAPAGITGKIGWHTLRHSFASHLVSAGAPLKVVQEALGHSSYEMTLRYAHLSPSTMHQTMKLLPRLTASHGESSPRPWSQSDPIMDC